MVTLIAACTSQGSHYPCDDQSPKYLIDELVGDYKKIFMNGVQQEKSMDQHDKAKNLMAVNTFNQQLYDLIQEQSGLVITVGGDHSVAIGSGLASLKKHGTMGLIWLDSHSDYHTLLTTESGNLHGLPFATLTGHNQILSRFHQGDFYNPNRCVLIGGRSIDEGEVINLQRDGIKVFTTAQVTELGIDYVIAEALSIACDNNEGFHLSLDLDLLDPTICPGVSVPEVSGMNEQMVLGLVDGLMRSHKVRSMDLVEYNALHDPQGLTKRIAVNLLKRMIQE
jgi:arginase